MGVSDLKALRRSIPLKNKDTSVTKLRNNRHLCIKGLGRGQGKSKNQRHGLEIMIRQLQIFYYNTKTSITKVLKTIIARVRRHSGIYEHLKQSKW